MAQIEYLFIDNGGVLTDNAQRRLHYRRLVGEYFSSRYGGSQADWAEANLNVVLPAWQRFLDRVSNWELGDDIRQAIQVYHAAWLRFLFAAKGLTSPDSDDECAAISHASERWINPQIVTLFAGIEDCVRTLASRYRLFTASDGFSNSLRETLRPVAEYFDCLYGPDLVNIPKSSGRAYYDAIFAHASVQAARSLVLDDNLSNILAAQEAGACTIYVSSRPDARYRGITIPELTVLPEVLEKL